MLVTIIDTIRYWLSAKFLEWGVRLVPDDLPRIRLQTGISIAVDLMRMDLERMEGEEFDGSDGSEDAIDPEGPSFKSSRGETVH